MVDESFHRLHSKFFNFTTRLLQTLTTKYKNVRDESTSIQKTTTDEFPGHTVVLNTAVCVRRACVDTLCCMFFVYLQVLP